MAQIPESISHEPTAGVNPKETEREHSTTPSDVADFGEDEEDIRMRRLEYLEKQFTQFSQFCEQRNQKEGASKTASKVEQRSRKRLSSKEKVCFTESPAFIKGEMRDYQVAGLNWMVTLYENGMNGILADEMGLGKTLQSISMIGYLKYHKKINGPFLVIVPLSTIENWIGEFRRFMPSTRVLYGHCYKSNKKNFRELLVDAHRNWDVVVTSYNFFDSEFTYFRKLNYQYVIVDEAQRCKNENTILSRHLRQTKFRNILFLTGTPINNNLHELWALLNLLLPEFFRNAEDFDSWFRVEDCIDPNHERALKLKNILQPILLRRIKADVELAIPPKLRTTLFIPQTHLMRYWSKRVIAKDIPMAKGDGTSTNFAMSALFVYLREVSLHPYLMPDVEPTPHKMGQHIVDASSRMIVLDRLLAKLKARGSRVLIFSQFKIMLNVLHDYLQWKKYKFCCLTGDLDRSERQQMIDEFNAPGSDYFIFMLTTRAGGVGINLPTADAVIFFDIDFNPQQDYQAEDRAHRIGQLKQVHVFRFIVVGTVDECLYNYSMRKRALDEAIIKKSLNAVPAGRQRDAVLHQVENLETSNNIDALAVDSQLDEIFAEVDRGDRNAELGTLCKDVTLKARAKRSRVEEIEMARITMARSEHVVKQEPLDLAVSGYVFKPRASKRARYSVC